MIRTALTFCALLSMLAITGANAQNVSDVVIMRRSIAPPRPASTPTPAPVPEISNGDFEAGTLKDWKSSGTIAVNAPAYAGKYAAEIWPGAVLSQSFNSTTGTTYGISLWAYSTQANPPSIGIRDAAGNLLVSAGLNGTSGNYLWKKFSFSFKGTGGPITVSIGNGNGLKPRIDNVVLTVS